MCRLVPSTEWVLKQGGHIVTQHPGQLLGSRLPHSVTGVSLWSVAWNTCCSADIPKYVATELAIANYLRANPAAQKLHDRAKHDRLVISPALMREYVDSTKAENKPPHYDRLKEAANLLAAGACFECKFNIVMPVLNVSSIVPFLRKLLTVVCRCQIMAA